MTIASFAFRFCERCLTNTDNEQKFDIWKLPPILVIHLKRFSVSIRCMPINYTYGVYCIHVCDTDSFTINTLIVYLEMVTRKLHGMYYIHQQGKFRNHNNYYRNCNLPTCTNYRLDLSKYVIGCHPSNAIYELYGVINHYGMLYAGHCEVYSYHLLNKANIYLPQTLLL